MDDTEVNTTHHRWCPCDTQEKEYYQNFYKKYFEDRLTETHNLILNEEDNIIREQLVDLYKHYIDLSRTYKNTYNK